MDRASDRDPRAEEGAVETARGPLAEGPLQKRKREWGEKSEGEGERRWRGQEVRDGSEGLIGSEDLVVFYRSRTYKIKYFIKYFNL